MDARRHGAARTRELEQANQALQAEIAERKQAEQELRESEERFRATFEQAAVGIAHLSPEGRWLRVNQRLCDIIGYTREELVQQTFPDITHPDDLETDYPHLLQMLAGEIQTYSMEKRYLAKDRSIVWINNTVSLVRAPSGDPLYFISVIEDIRRRKSVEEQLGHAQKLETIGQLAGGIAHDFNNLLAIVLGYAEFAADKVSVDDPVREDLQQIQGAAERAADLTRQLLAFARRQVIQPRVIDLNDLVHNLDRMLRRLIGEDIELVTLLDPSLWPVKVDPGQLEQVLVNLTVNARDAMPQGGRLTIETANVTLDAGYARGHVGVLPGEYVMLAVTDTGLGMTEEVRSRIFEPFFTTKGQGKGTGLGLATVYGIVKQSGGDIWVYSEPEHGTTFKVYLSRALATAELLSRKTTVTAAPRGTETVLVVEDAAQVREIAAQALRAHGYTVLEAGSGGEALIVASEYSRDIHLLLTDVVMPQMSGRMLAERLLTARPGMRVLYASGYTDNTIEQHGVLDPGLLFLQKPFTPLSLARKVREALDTEEPRDG